MKKLNFIFIFFGYIFLITSCCILKSNLSYKQQVKIDKIFYDYPDSKELLLKNASLLKIDNDLIEPKKVRATLLKIDTSENIKITVFSNFKTVAESTPEIKYDLIKITTENKTADQSDLKTGYNYLMLKMNSWLKNNSEPYLVINGKPFKYESDYKPFLEELKESDIKSIDILYENIAMLIYNYKSVLIISTMYSE